MKRTAAQFGIMLIMALAGPLTARGDTTETAKSETPTTATAERTVIAEDNYTTGMAAVVASNLPMARVVSQMEHQSKIPIAMKGGAANTKVTVIAPRPKPVELLLQEMVEGRSNLVFKEAAANARDRETTGYEIWLEDEYYQSASVVEIYQLNETSARDMERLVAIILDRGTDLVEADNRLNKLIVHTVPEKQAEVKQLLAELDQKLAMRVYTLRHRNANNMMLTLMRFFSIPDGNITIDPEASKVAVRGTSETLARVGQLIETFDVPPVQKGDAGTTAPQ